MDEEKNFEEVNKMILERKAEQKFSYKKVGSFYYIIDTETGNKCITEEGKTTPFKAKTVSKLGEELYKLRTAYYKHLKNLEEGE